MTQETKKDLMRKLSDLEIKSTQIENRKQFKNLLDEINSVNTPLVIEAGIMVKGLPTIESVDEIPEGKLDDVAFKVQMTITDAEDCLDRMKV